LLTVAVADPGELQLILTPLAITVRGWAQAPLQAFGVDCAGVSVAQVLPPSTVRFQPSPNKPVDVPANSIPGILLAIVELIVLPEQAQLTEWLLFNA
jgi:hypothetical protein